MGWRDTWYPHAVSAMRTLRGDGPLGPDGIRVALLKPTDTIALVGQFVSPMRSAILSFERNQVGDDQADRMVTSSGLSDGATVKAIAKQLPSITVAAYLGGRPVGDGPKWRRAPVSLTDGTLPWGITAEDLEISYEPWIDIGGTLIDHSEPELLGFVRSTVTAYQRVIDASGYAIQTGGVDLSSAWVSTDATIEVWTAIRQLCTQLDVLRENPPRTENDQVLGALRQSLTDTEKFAGEAAAAAANEVGGLAGNVGKGFFGNVGAEGLIVAGLAVVLFLR